MNIAKFHLSVLHDNKNIELFLQAQHETEDVILSIKTKQKNIEFV